MNVIHFKNQKDRLDFLKGNFEEIIPQEITPKVADEGFEKLKAECGDCPAWDGTDCTRHPYKEGCLKDEPKAEEPKKTKRKGKKKDDKVQAE